MSRGGKALNGVTVALLLAGTSWLVRRATASGWEMVTDEPAPKDQSNLNVELSDAATWAVLSGAAVGLARLLVRRTVAYRGSPLDERSTISALIDRS